MNTIEMPDDLKRAPYEIVRDFIIEFNKALVSGAGDPPEEARNFLIQKYADEEKTQGKIFLQSEMKGCFGQEVI